MKKKFDKTPQFDYKDKDGVYNLTYTEGDRPFLQSVYANGLLNKYEGQGFKKVVKVDYLKENWFQEMFKE